MNNNNIKAFSPVTALFIWICHIGIAAFFYTRGQTWELPVYHWATLFVIVASLPYIAAIFKKNFVLYEAKYLFLAAFVFSNTACMFLSLDEISLDIKLWTDVMKLLIPSVIVFLLGYKLKLGKAVAEVLPVRNFIIPEKTLLRLVPKLYLMGWILRIFPMITARLGPDLFFVSRTVVNLQGWQIMSILMSKSIYAALMLDAYFYFSSPQPGLEMARKRKHLHRLLFFFTIELLYAFTATGMKENILIPMILVLIIYLKTKKKIPYVALTLVAIIFIGYIMPFINIYRKERYVDIKFKEAIQYTFEQMSMEDERRDARFDSVKRLSNPLEISVVSTDLREKGIAIRTYRDIFDYLSRFIPRFLWPTKPIVDYNWIGREMGVLDEDDYFTSVGLTLVGSLILNHGPYGVIIGMFVVGFILRIYWEWLIVRSGDNLFSFMTYFIVLYMWLRLDELLICLHSNLSFLVYLYLMVVFIKKSNPPGLEDSSEG